MLSEKSREILNYQLREGEGNVLHVYKDSLGLETIGIGRCLKTKGLSKTECDHLGLGVYSKQGVIDVLTKRGINQNESDYLVSNDIDDVFNDLSSSLSWFANLPEMIKIILMNMAFNLGATGLLGFHTTLGLIKNGDYMQASKQMLNSKWAEQVPNRAKRLSNLLANC